jgi:phosphoribosylformimino-5-aminoimidazole carboxamide ribotide isomerase
VRLIPAIDLRAGRCVRLLKGDFAVETLYPVAPLQLLARYRALGAEWLHVVDLDAARDGAASRHGANGLVIAELAAQPGIKLQVGGGLRDESSVRDALDHGAARVVVGTAALTDAEAVQRWFRAFGGERIALAFDVRLDKDAVPRVTTHGWRAQSVLSLWDAVARFTDAGLVHVLCTDVSRDGALSGPNVTLYAEAARRYPQIAWQASGGVRDACDLHVLARCGAASAISGTGLLENLILTEELGPFLQSA